MTSSVGSHGKMLLGAMATGGGVLGIGMASRMINESFPSSLKEVQPRSRLENGRYVIGCFGGPKDFNLNRERDLYFGDMQIAQKYAKHNQGAVYVITANRPTDAGDYGIQRFEGPHVPLGSHFLQDKEADVNVEFHHIVNEDNAIGTVASLKRAWRSMQREREFN